MLQTRILRVPFLTCGIKLESPSTSWQNFSVGVELECRSNLSEKTMNSGSPFPLVLADEADEGIDVVMVNQGYKQNLQEKLLSF